MFVVLMAIIDFSRTKVHAATRWLWLALSGGLFVAAPLGCEEEEQQVLYGPPADCIEYDEGEMQDLYGAPPDYSESDVVEDPGFQPEYGPPCCDIDETDIYVDNGQISDVQVLYGPPPDYIQYDTADEDVQAIDSIQPLYGPAVDVIDKDVAPADASADIPQTLYGVPVK